MVRRPLTIPSTNVLLVSQEMPPETGWGGIGTYVGQLAPALAAAGADVHVLSVVVGQSRSTVRRDDGVVVHRAPLARVRGIGRLTGLPMTWQRVSQARGVRREYRRLATTFDVIEAPDWMAEGLLLTVPRVAPLIVRLHSSLAQIGRALDQRGVDVALAAQVENLQVRRASLVTGTASALDERADELGRWRVPTAIVPCPVAEAPITDVPVDPPRIGFLGRFEPRKGIETLVRALPRVSKDVPGVRLALVGRDMPDAAGNSTLARILGLARELGVAEHLEIVDTWQDADGVRHHLERSTVCVVPSTWESFGYAAAEALAHGRPVVASDVPALSELVEPGVTGQLVPPGDHVAWAHALADLLRSPESVVAMGRAAADHVRLRASPTVAAQRALAAYERACSVGTLRP